ncbi:hypothetical protein BDQ17DRAFT_1548136 [Cyathus striatus]|nr:hypothetical protein BDQ17DRAFT_1548136 [Cyathus striatus]
MMKRSRYLLEPKNWKRAKTNTQASIPSEPTPLPDEQIIAFNPTSWDNRTQLPICSARTQLLPELPAHYPTALIATRIPGLIDTHETAECIFYHRTHKAVVNLPEYPRSPAPPDHSWAPYEIRKAGSEKGLGIFAKRALKVGDLIVAERPLLVIPMSPNLDGVANCPYSIRKLMRDARGRETPMGLIEPILEVAFERMSKKNQDAYLDLANTHMDDGSTRLCAIWKTNVIELHFDFDDVCEGDTYGAVMKEMARVNHSCRPNCAYSFDPASFSFELRASKSINRGEEIIYSYCDLEAPAENRQATLQSYGFSCECISCIPAARVYPSSDAIRTTILPRVQWLSDENQQVLKDPNAKDMVIAKKVYHDAIQLMLDMEKEGMDGYKSYRFVMQVRVSMCFAFIEERKRDALTLKCWEDAKTLKEPVMRLCLVMDGSFKTKNHPWIEQSPM